jgi:hypothetical protein
MDTFIDIGKTIPMKGDGITKLCRNITHHRFGGDFIRNIGKGRRGIIL